VANVRFSTASISAHLDHLEAGWHQLEVELGRAQWDLYTTGESKEMDVLKQLQAEIFADQSVYRLLTTWQKAKLPPLTARRVQLARDYWLSSHVGSRLDLATLEQSVAVRLNSARVEFRGKTLTQNQVEETMRFDRDRKTREQIWRADNDAVGKPIERDLLKLIALRNKHARSLGYKNFFDMNLELSELDWPYVDRLMRTVERATAAPMLRERKRQARAMHLSSPHDLQPWDVSFDYDGTARRLKPKYPRSKLLPSLRRTYKKFGFDLSRYSIQWDLESRPGKSQHAFCFGIDPPHDVRVLANLAPGARSYHVMFHEVGHAVYDVHLNHDCWLFRHPASAWWTEGIAEFFDRLRYNPRWQRSELGFSARDVADAERMRKVGLLAMLRFTLALVRFERALYVGRVTTPAAARSLWTRVMEPLLVHGVPVTADWATVPHYISAPAYYFHYLLAECAADQLYASIGKRFGANFASKPAAGKWLADNVFAQGCQIPAAALLQQVTKKKLGPEALLRELR